MFLFKEQAILRRVKRRFPELKIKNIKVRVVPATDKKAADRLYGEILQRGKNEKH